jgi:MOSC domain-containing protein YiiM
MPPRADRNAAARRADEAGMSTARVVSVNVGLPHGVPWRGRTVQTAIFKEPVAGRVAVRHDNLAGDRQGDLSVHGGPAKAVYAYPAEHYAPWKADLGTPLSWGAFGENLTVAGLPLEDEVHVGDRLAVGSAVLAVTQPRLPCFKLGIRFGRKDVIARMLATGRTGWYLAIVEEGDLAAGDPIEIVDRHPAAVPVSAITRTFAQDRTDLAALERLAALEPLPADWRGWARRQLARTG